LSGVIFLFLRGAQLPDSLVDEAFCESGRAGKSQNTHTKTVSLSVSFFHAHTCPALIQFLTNGNGSNLSGGPLRSTNRSEDLLSSRNLFSVARVINCGKAHG